MNIYMLTNQQSELSSHDKDAGQLPIVLYDFQVLEPGRTAELQIKRPTLL